MNSYTPPVGFYFKLYLNGNPAPEGKDAAFQEVSGISRTSETKEVVVGG